MTDYDPKDGLLKPDRPVGIVGYGAYVPRYRLPATEVSRMWKGGTGGKIFHGEQRLAVEHGQQRQAALRTPMRTVQRARPSRSVRPTSPAPSCSEHTH